MNLNNLQRDMLHVTAKVMGIKTYATAVSAGSGFFTVNADLTVQSEIGAVQTYGQAPTVGAGAWAGAGVFMEPPRYDNVPYRFKGHISDLTAPVFINVGYAQNTITGTDDSILTSAVFPVHGRFDEIVKIPALADTDPDFGKPLCFAIVVGENAGNNVIAGYLSVQKMDKATPRFASSSS